MARVFISCRFADKEKVLPLQAQIEAAIGEPCWSDADSTTSEDALAGFTIMQELNQASIVILMYSLLHAEIADYKSDWAVRELNYAQESGKRIVFVGIDQIPLSKWFMFMFPQQELIDASSAAAWQQLLCDLPEWLNTAKNEHVADKTDYTEGLEYAFDTATKEATVISVGSATSPCIIIPPKIEHDGIEYTIVAIAPKAFQMCYDMTTIKIPNTVVEIGESAFERCASLASITLPPGIKEIKKSTFGSCSSLLSVSIPETVIRICKHSFIDCKNLNTVRLPDSLQYIGYGAFANCTNLTTVNIPASVKRVAFMAFYNTRTPRGKASQKWIFLNAIIINIIFWGGLVALIVYLVRLM